MIWSAAFVLGFAGSLHCIGMCGPLAVMISGRNPQAVVLNRLVYNAGRTITYMLLGALIGMVGTFAKVGGVQNIFSIVIGISILVFLLFYKSQPVFISLFNKMIGRLKRSFLEHQKGARMYSAFATGVFNGFLPCGLVYAAIAVAVVQTSVLESAGVMLFFGLGTIPALLLTAYSFQRIKQLLPFSWRKIQQIILVMIAVIMIGRGLQQELIQRGEIAQSEIVCD
jgi:sulfite exporter TauE/SafE